MTLAGRPSLFPVWTDAAAVSASTVLVDRFKICQGL